MSYFQQIARRVSSGETARGRSSIASRSQPIPQLNPPKPLFPPVPDLQLREFAEEPFAADAAGITAEVSRSSRANDVPSRSAITEQPLSSPSRTSHLAAPAPPKRLPESSATIAPRQEVTRDSAASPPTLAQPTLSPQKPALERQFPVDGELTVTERQAAMSSLERFAIATPELISKSLESPASNVPQTAGNVTFASTQPLPAAQEAPTRNAPRAAENVTFASTQPLPAAQEAPTRNAPRAAENVTRASTQPLPATQEVPTRNAPRAAENVTSANTKPLPTRLKPQPSTLPLPEKRAEIPAPSPLKPDTSEPPTVRIGAIDIQIIPPVAPEVRGTTSLAPASGSLSRGFTSEFGLRQG